MRNDNLELDLPEDRCSSCARGSQVLFIYTKEMPGFVVESVVLCAKCNSKYKLDGPSWKKTLRIRTPVSLRE